MKQSEVSAAADRRWQIQTQLEVKGLRSVQRWCPPNLKLHGREERCKVPAQQLALLQRETLREQRKKSEKLRNSLKHLEKGDQSDDIDLSELNFSFICVRYVLREFSILQHPVCSLLVFTTGFWFD